MEFLIIGGAVLAAVSFRHFLKERRRAALLARLARYDTETGGRAAGYYPGSLSDPRD